MKAKPIVYRGIHFRSKTEARWYIFMKKLGWNVEYEPEIPGLYGWLPDFIILGPKGSKVLVEVKPFKNNFDFESNYGIETLNKIGDTKWYELGEYKERDASDIPECYKDSKYYNAETKKQKYFKPEYDGVLIFGSSLAISGYKHSSLHGGHIIRPRGGDIHDNNRSFYSDDFSWIDYPTEEYDFGICDLNCSYKNIIDGEYDGRFHLSREGFEKLECYWNEAWTELRWKGKEVA